MLIFIFAALILVTLVEFFLASYVLNNGPRSNIHQLAAARDLMMGLFAFFSIFFYSATTFENADLWNRIRTVPFIFVPILIFLFAWVWTQKNQGRIFLALSFILFAASLLFQYFNFISNLLGYPIQNPGTNWIAVVAGDLFWPLTFLTCSILLVVFSVILSIYHFTNLKDAAEKKSQLPVLMAIPAVAILNILLGLAPVSFRPDFLFYIPFWMLAADILTAIGLTSKRTFVPNFSSAFYPIIQSTNEAVVLVDLEAVICAANATFCRLVEKSESELIGRPLSQFFLQEQFSIAQVRKEPLQQKPQWITGEMKLNGGNVLSIAITAIPVYHQGSQRASAILISDLSSQKDAKDKLDSLKIEIAQNFEKKIQELETTNDLLNDQLAVADQEQKRLHRKVFELEALSNLSTELRTARSIQDLMNLLLLKTTDILNADAGIIFLRNGNELVVKCILGVPDDFKGYHYPYNRDHFWMAMESGQAVFLNGKGENPATEFPVFLTGMVSAVVCPLMTQERQIGLVVLGFKFTTNFSEKDRQFLESIGKIISNALYRSSAMESLEQSVSSRTRELETLFHIASIANEAQSPNTILNQALRILLETLTAKVGVILMDNKVNELFISAQPVEYLAEIEDELRSISTQNSLWWTTYHNNQPILIQSLEEDNRIDVGIVTELIVLGNCSVVCAPIRGSGGVLGSVCLFKDARKPFLPEDLAILNTVSHQLGITVEVIRLRRLEEQKSIGEEHHKIASKLPETVSQLIISQVKATERGLKSIQSGDQASAESEMELVKSTAVEALKEIRLLDYLLSPAPIASLGLYKAIRHRLQSVEQSAFIRATLTGEYTFKLPGNVEENLFEVIQETLNLILRKACASDVNVRFTSDYDSVDVEISHNGNDVVAGETQELANLREKIESIGGKLALEANADQIRIFRIKV